MMRKIIAFVIIVVLIFTTQGVVGFIKDTNLNNSHATEKEKSSTTISAIEEETFNDKPEKDSLTSTAIDETDISDEDESVENSKPTIPASRANNGNTFDTPNSINGILNPADVTKIAIIPGTDGTEYQQFAPTITGLQAALFELYINGGNANYILYVGSNLTVPSAVGAREPPMIPTLNNISFSSLIGKIGALTLVSSQTDPTSSTTTAPSDAKTLTFESSVYMSNSLVLRNIKYSVSSIYMQGHSLTLDHGSYSTRTQGLSVYGGRDTGTITGNPVITVNSTGTGEPYNFYGGNQSGGTLIGNPSIIINNTSGNISSVYGGGYGSISNPVTVQGNVSTTINNIQGSLSTVYGGVNHGNISGSITTTIKGNGSLTSTSSFFGGSYNGDIGSSLPTGSDAITSNLDSSKYSTGSISFIGGNNERGSIYGNINNKVTAGNYGKGSLRRFYGGGNSTILSATNVANSPPELRASIFESNAGFKVYGNITNELTKGCVGWSDEQGWLRGAGYTGYIEGNVSTTLGTQGLCYGGNSENTDMSLSSYYYARGYNSGFDIVAGGGTPATDHLIYIKGDTSLIQKYVLARWSSGASFSGYIEGNTKVELHSGIVDALEGAGYHCQGIYGDSSAYLFNGQVDYYLCGGGWNDEEIEGNVHVEVHGGMINASLSGTYGDSTRHIIKGNSTVLVTGGDFSGMPRDGSNGISAGLIYAGSIQGDSEVTIDLRDGKAFTAPKVAITGGRRNNATANQILGNNSSNTIKLNIFTNSGSDKFKDTTFYGDGGTSDAYTKSGSITINIDAPNSPIANVYATQYLNVLSSEIVKNVTINVTDAGTINTLCGTSSSDNFTNAVIANSIGKWTKINIGDAKSIDEEITVGSGGLTNFTELNIRKSTLMATSTGSVKNGRSATATNHGTTYSQFGNITISDHGGLGIENNSTAIISGGIFKANEGAKLLTPSGTGKVNITDVSVSPGERITWKRNGGDALASMSGSWFNSNRAYRVFTFTPTKSNASSITPANLFGIESTGKTFIGDYDVSGSTGYGIVIAGSVIEFKVTEGEGNIEHDVNNVSLGPSPVSVYGTPAKNEPAKSGILCIPASRNKPTLSFIPDTNLRTSIKEIVFSCSDESEEKVEEFNDFESAFWTSPSNEYSYTILSAFTDPMPNEVAFNFYKVDGADQNVFLEKAEFMLYRPGDEESIPDELVTSESLAQGIWVPVLTNEELHLKAESNIEGFVDFGILPNGTYMLVETTPPKGYTKPLGQWLIIADSNQNENSKIIITGKGEILPPAFMRDDEGNLLLLNHPALYFPTTGADKGIIITIIGIVLIICSLIMLLLRTYYSHLKTAHKKR